MIRYASFAVIALFWVLMNGLLWRSEFGSGSKIASSVPPSLVWEKILTAPDDSALSINLKGRKLGYLRIRPAAREAGTEDKVANENEPEGMVRRVTEYSLQFEGSMVAEVIARSLRFNSEFIFDRSMEWQQFQVETFVRPYRWQLKGNAAERDLWFQSTDGESEWIHHFTLDDLRNPQQLSRVIDAPMLTALIPQYFNSVGMTNATGSLSLGLDWQAQFEWLKIGRNRVRIYRLEAKLLDRHRVVVLVSRVGEILRVELPGELKLINEVLYAS
jgi:hypothetical protein